MAMIKTFRQFYLILLLYINLPMNTAEVVIAVPYMSPIINTKYYVLCNINVGTGVEDVEFLDKDVIIEGKNLKCTITDWKFCNKAAPPQVNGACGCRYKKPEAEGGFKYEFYLLVDPVSEDFIGSQIICQLDSNKQFRQLEVVRFTKSPERILYKCINTSVLLNWEFNPSRDTIEERFNVARVSWSLVGPNGSVSKRNIGTYYLTTHGEKKFTNDGHVRSSIINATGKIPKLNVSNLVMADSKQNVTINVTFDQKQMLNRSKRFIPINITEFLSFDRNNDTDDGGEVTADDNSTAFTPTVARTTQTSTTKLTTTETTRPTQPTTTTPAPVEITLDNPDNHMLDTVHLIVTEPPLDEITVTIKAYESLTGNLVVTCQIDHMTFQGHPPVNVTIWLDGKRLITRSGIKVLHYSTVTEGKIISCGLEGHALDCLEKGDQRLQQAVFDLKDLEKSKKPTQGVDLLLSLYAWESIICLVLMMWVISLLLDHTLFVVRKAKRELEARNKALLEAERRRPIVLARIKR